MIGQGRATCFVRITVWDCDEEYRTEYDRLTFVTEGDTRQSSIIFRGKAMTGLVKDKFM